MKKRIIICDIDGTIADLNHRLHFIKNEDGTKKRGAAADWKSFHAGCADDAPITDVIEIVKSLAVGRNVFFVSGRNATARAETEQWIKKYFNFKWADGCNLFMRKGHDFRPDTVVQNCQLGSEKMGKLKSKLQLKLEDNLVNEIIIHYLNL